MNGAEALVRSAVAAGIEVCFANPGTTELALVRALEAAPAIRPVLTLFEGVATGAADGYARMAEKPALTLVHLGPSLGNGLANLHNARRARSPVVNLVGDHPAWHRALDPPLASDIEAIAGAVSAFVRTAREAAHLPSDFADAVAAACRGHIATLIVPADCQSGPVPDIPPPPRAHPAIPKSTPARVAAAAAALRTEGAGLLLGGKALRAPGLRAAQRIATAARARLFVEGFPARLEHFAGAPTLERLAYVPAAARRQLGNVGALVLADAPSPVPYFAEAEGASALLPAGMNVCPLLEPGDHVEHALEALADALGAPPHVGASAAKRERAVPASTTPLSPATTAGAVAALQPEGVIFVDEGVSAGGVYLRFSAAAPLHTYLSATGGATGFGLPCAVGASIACPDRKTVAFVGDGSAMYTVQSLWTIARESLDILTIVCSNGAYRILQLEMESRGGSLGAAARRLTDLHPPKIDWTHLSRGLGVPAARVKSTPELVLELERAFSERGPKLLEVQL